MACETAVSEGREIGWAESLRHAIHIWRIPLPALAPFEPALRGVLSEEERSRSMGFAFFRDRRRFTITRGALRVLLGRYTDNRPTSISICATPSGKPFAAHAGAPQFSVSHSDEIALLAFGHGQMIGVDVERLRQIPERSAIAKQFFSSQECKHLLSLPEKERNRAFLTCWTRKEAYFKATGEGLAALSWFRVSPDPDTGARIGDDSLFVRSHKWRILDIHVSEGYMAALATDSSQQPLPLFEFSIRNPVPRQNSVRL